MKFTARSFYRPASSGALPEDGFAMNPAEQQGKIYEEPFMAVVCDGVSGPFSPSNPKLDYGNGISGGQMVTKDICEFVAFTPLFPEIEEVLLCANAHILLTHKKMGLSPGKEAVAGACVAACQVKKNAIKLILVGDCVVFWWDEEGVHFLTNFDQAAFEFEASGNGEFERCRAQAGGDIGKAWDLFFPYFDKKQLFRANQNVGKGGHAMVNGDPALERCWTSLSISLPRKIQWMLLCTDGLLPSSRTSPAALPLLAEDLAKEYEAGGIPAIVALRDREDNLPHIQGWPEGTLIELKFIEQ